MSTKMRCIGASILPISICPNHSPYFLLGKEKYHKHWKESERWSDFGGRRNADDKDAEDIAAREFFEETMQMVKFFKDDHLPRKRYDDIAESLRQQNFLFKILFPVKSDAYYCCFVVHIPFQINVQDDFKLYRTEQVAKKHTADTVTSEMVSSKIADGVLDDTFFEKTSVKYFGLRQSYIAAAKRGILQYKRSGNEILRSIFKERLKTVSTILPYTTTSTTESITSYY